MASWTTRIKRGVYRKRNRRYLGVGDVLRQPEPKPVPPPKDK